MDKPASSELNPGIQIMTDIKIGKRSQQKKIKFITEEPGQFDADNPGKEKQYYRKKVTQPEYPE
ncbi:MAG: hypothetical protein JW874_03675 [Spirochaetales bacterium]|nr:hypothetical protein [Spirochaetales bacterium]